MTGRPRILILASHARNLLNFRGPLLTTLIKQGWRVTAFAPEIDDETNARLSAMGVATVETPVSRNGINPMSDLAYCHALVGLFRRERPDVLFAYTAKPVIWGTLAARMAGVPRVVAMITGLGYAFTPPERPDWTHRIARLAAGTLYRLALPRADHVLFQNPDDRDMFQRLAFNPPPHRVGLIAGSGVDLDHYAPSPPPATPSFLMLARLLKAKGVREYFAVARSLKHKYPNVEFRLGGAIDPGPDAIAAVELEAAVADGITYLGPLEDVRPALAEAAVFVLPSYREGTPRSVLEALATGRAVITTNAPGCRETVVAGVNGLLVPPRDASALESAIECLLKDPALIATMGRKSLELARSKYDVHTVNEQIIAALKPLGGDDNGADKL